MAKSNSHAWGQKIGEVLEVAFLDPLLEFAKNHDLYLDCKGVRPARRGKKVRWEDEYGNAHDLDYVLEKGGSDRQIGKPIAFIETAWRGYTKHSKNKAQEIQGAILPLVQKHHYSAPFTGVILAGAWTGEALNQLKNFRFQVLYLPYPSVVEAFSTVGIDAGYTEETKRGVFQRKIKDWNLLLISA